MSIPSDRNKADQECFDAFIPEGSDMGALIRSIDWSKTPVGPVEGWPQSLKTTISNVLACRFPMMIAWGEEFTQLYNDAYAPILGSLRHPRAMGRSTRESWAEIWDTLEPFFASVMETGRTNGVDDLPLLVTRNELPEESYFSFSYGAIRNETGHPCGVLVSVFDTTERVRAERSIKEARERELHALNEVDLARQDLYDFIMQAPAPMSVLLGPDHRFSVANLAYEAMAGRRVVGKTVLEAFTREEAGDFIQLLDGVYQTGTPFLGKELPVAIPDGTGVIQHYLIDVAYHPFRDRSGAIKGVLAFHHDVTAQVLARKALESSRSDLASQQLKLETIFLESPEAMGLFHGPDHVFELVNPAYRRFFSEREFVGKPFLDAIPELRDQPLFFALLTKVRDSGESYVGHEVLARHARTTNGPIEDRYYNFTYIRMNDSEGNPYGVYFRALDVTDQLAARKAQEESERLYKAEQKKFKSIFYSAAAPMVLFRGPDFVYEMINSRYQELLPERQLVGKSLLEALPEIAATAFPETLAKVVESGEPQSLLGGLTPVYNSLTGLTEDRYFDVTCALIDDADAGPRGIFAYTTEVTERTLASRALELASGKLDETIQELRLEREIRERFAATLTHDLRTPLSVMKMSAQLIGSRADDTLTVRKFAERIANTVDRTDHLIRDLLDSSRLRAGEELSIEVEECKLTRLIQEVVDELATVHGERFTLTNPDDEIVGRWSAIAIRRILENMCSNAVKYGDRERRIAVVLSQTESRASLSVHNWGAVIPHEDRDILFDQYRRAKSAQAGREKGWGLGLGLVKGLAEAHGGTVALESTLELGTTFTVVLPKVHALG